MYLRGMDWLSVIFFFPPFSVMGSSRKEFAHVGENPFWKGFSC